MVGYTHQKHLENVLRNIFPEKNATCILQNKRRETILPSIKRGHLELDFWVPEQKLAFEFQDAHHYVTSWYSRNTVTKTQSKIEALKKRGETLICVPCWWDGSKESLIATIQQERPDLFPDHIPSLPPISPHPPPNFFRNDVIPHVGELMQPSFTDPFHFDPLNWWLLEKYDGIRAVWSPVDKSLYTRNRNALSLSDSLTLSNILPDIFIDGEIWFGRGEFRESRKLVALNRALSNSSSPSPSSSSSSTFSSFSYSFATLPDISALRFMCFDSPPTSHSLPPNPHFEHRYESLLSRVFCDIASAMTCVGKGHSKKALEAVIENGGEGIIMVKPDSLYQRGRSSLIQKLKGTVRDAEALVVALSSSPGTYDLQLPSGASFQAKLSNNYSDENPKVGDIIQFSSEDYSATNEPIDPHITRIRFDLDWNSVLFRFVNSSFKSSVPQEVTQQTMEVGMAQSKKPFGYWTNKENVKSFFDSLVKDPLNPECWYSVTLSSVIKAGGSKPMQLYGSLLTALRDIYPNLEFDLSRFITMPRSYWSSQSNRKKFFDKIAEKKGFDPLVAANWHLYTRKEILAEKGGLTLIGEYSSYKRAVQSVYPNIGLVNGKFSSYNWSKWRNIETQRKYFDDYAAKNQFDSLVAANWYTVNARAVTITLEGRSILSLYKRHLPSALMAIYPDIGLDIEKFGKERFWLQSTNRRFFFEKLARDKGLDPLSPSTWYCFPVETIRETTGGTSIMHQFSHSLPQALIATFPEIGLEEQNFI